jgi:uracil-DNA glycosylase
MSVYQLLYEKDYPGWSEKLTPYKGAIKNISNIISKKEEQYGPYYPKKENLFKALEMTPLHKVKVVIWGQDPYPTLLDDGTPRAQGYSFGVRKDDDVPKSLENIYKELKDNFPMFQPPKHGDLTWLAEQGILFMNSSLTYCPKDPKCYLNLWNRFTNILINIINESVENCIHLLWGKNCEKLAEHIHSREVFTCAHPSPLSAYRGFFGCKHFLKVNITLSRQEKEQINWNENKDLTPTYIENLKDKNL